MQILIRNARVVDPQSGFYNQVVDILIENGIVKQIGIGIGLPGNDCQIVEGEGLMVSSGWVDIFADYCEPGLEQKEEIATGLAAAAAGGFTDVFVLPNTNPAISTKSVVEFAISKAKGNIVNLHPLGAATQNIAGKDLAEMMDMRNSGAVAFTDGWNPIQNAGLALKALEYIKAFNGVLLQVPNDASLSAGGLMNEGEVSTMLGMPGIPELAETMLLHRDIELLRYTGSKLHVTGISTATSVAMVKKAKEDGLQITCSVTPYHLALTEDALKNYNSIYKVNPPLRGEQDRQALIKGLNDGVIDCIATHHHPHEWDAKTKEFEYASNGMALQESAFNVVWDSVCNDVAVERIIEALTMMPRDIFGLGEKGINVGDKACITIFTTESNNLLENKDVQSKSRNNPFIGKELKGKVLGIINNNQIHLNK